MLHLVLLAAASYDAVTDAIREDTGGGGGGETIAATAEVGVETKSGRRRRTAVTGRLEVLGKEVLENDAFKGGGGRRADTAQALEVVWWKGRNGRHVLLQRTQAYVLPHLLHDPGVIGEHGGVGIHGGGEEEEMITSPIQNMGSE